MFCDGNGCEATKDGGSNYGADSYVCQPEGDALVARAVLRQLSFVYEERQGEREQANGAPLTHVQTITGKFAADVRYPLPARKASTPFARV